MERYHSGWEFLADMLKAFFYFIVAILAVLGAATFYTAMTSNDGIFTSEGFKRRAVEMNAAHYNSTNGEFEYTDERLKHIMLGEQN